MLNLWGREEYLRKMRRKSNQGPLIGKQRKKSADLGNYVIDECQDEKLLCRNIESFGLFKRVLAHLQSRRYSQHSQ